MARCGFDPIVIVYLADEIAASAAQRAVEELGARCHVVRADASTDAGLAAILAALDDHSTPLAAVVVLGRLPDPRSVAHTTTPTAGNAPSTSR